MMQDPIEDKQFEDLLSDYAAPVNDGGFSIHVMAQLPSPSANTQDTENLRRRFIGGGAIIGAAIAATQLPALLKLTSKLNAPEVSMPALASVDTSALLTSSGMAMAALALMGVIWLSSTFIFGDQM